MTELTNEDRELVRWFAEERLGWTDHLDDTGPNRDGWSQGIDDDLLGWPGFGRAAEEARKAGLVVMLYHGLKGAQDWLVWIERDPEHEHTDPALAAYAALRDALGVH